MSTNRWGLRSNIGNQELWICTITRWPFLKVWYLSPIEKASDVTSPGTSGSGFDGLFLNFARWISPASSIWNPPILTC